MSFYEAYFDAQIGRGKEYPATLETVCSYGQTGSGIGRFLGGLYRRVLPLLKKGSREVGKEAVRAGLNVVNDFASNKKPLKDAITQRIKESGLKLKRKAEEKLDKLMDNNKYKMLKSSHEAHLDIDSDTEQSDNDEKLKVKKSKLSKKKTQDVRKNKKKKKKKKKKKFSK